MVTRWYRPLEIVLNLPYNEKVDVFAVGALIFSFIWEMKYLEVGQISINFTGL